MAVRAEPRFYSSYTLAILLAIVVGFAPSFFLRGLVEPFAPSKPLRPAVLVHGLVTTAWVLMLPLQARLIGAGRRAMHQQLGKVGFALGAVMTGPPTSWRWVRVASLPHRRSRGP